MEDFMTSKPSWLSVVVAVIVLIREVFCFSLAVQSTDYENCSLLSKLLGVSQHGHNNIHLGHQ